MALGLGAAVHSIMLGTGMRLVILGISRPLHAPDYRHTHTGGQVGILPPSFLPSSPTWVAENVHIGIPKRQSFVAPSVTAMPPGIMEFGTPLIAHRHINIFYQLVVEHGSHPHSNGINRSQTVTGHSVQRLAPPIIRLDAQTLHAGRLVLHQRDFLFQRQPFQQIVRTLLRRQIRIFIRFILRRRGRSRHDSHTESKNKFSHIFIVYYSTHQIHCVLYILSLLKVLLFPGI